MLRSAGQVAGYCRAPLRDLTPDQVERLRVLLEPIDAVAGRLTSMAGVSLLVRRWRGRRRDGQSRVSSRDRGGRRPGAGAARRRDRRRGRRGGSTRRARSSRPASSTPTRIRRLVVLEEPALEGKVLQGVTTEVVGIDGLSYAPVPSPDDLRAFVAHQQRHRRRPRDRLRLARPAGIPRACRRPRRAERRLVRGQHGAADRRAGLATTRPRRPNRPPTRYACSRRRWRRARSASRRASTTRPGRMPRPTSWSSSRGSSRGTAASTTPTSGTRSVTRYLDPFREAIEICRPSGCAAPRHAFRALVAGAVHRRRQADDRAARGARPRRGQSTSRSTRTPTSGAERA